MYKIVIHAAQPSHLHQTNSNEMVGRTISTRSARVSEFLMLLVVLVVSLLCVQFASAHSDDLVVKTNNGRVRGTEMQSKKGRQIDGFLSIPYAEPPVGDLRFKPPVAYHTWDDILDATQQHGVCPQRNIYTRSNILEGDEDCLYLNVYRPHKPKTNKPLPVMFFIHGGGWLSCAGNTQYYGPEILLEKDVILVIPNYRLGALGFLSTGDMVVPGNNGLKDMVLALKWTQDNVAHFGGDPKSVTIFGESAGGASVHLFLMSPLTKGLFHRGISQSGTGLCLWAFGHEHHGREQAQKLGQVLKCPNVEDSQALIDCLKTKDALEIAGMDEEFMLWDKDPMIPFRPTKEPEHEGAFITDFPANLVKAGKVHNVPWMNGINKDDGALRAAAIYGVSGLFDQLKENFEYNMAVSIQYHQLADDPVAISKKIKEFYFPNGLNRNESKQGVVDLYTDGWFHHGVDLGTYLHKKHVPHIPVYYYEFGHRGIASFSNIFGDPVNDYGVCHADELQYLFPVGDGLFPDKIKDAKDLRVTDALTQLWVNFARNGNPTSQNDDGTDNDEFTFETIWEPVENSERMNYYYIGGDAAHELRNEDGLFIERAKFWRELPIRPETYKQRLQKRSTIKQEL